ncbi:choice-of-anchor B family protein [Lewinella sp. JB7]|uniref:choice-of-anchor B family protein n=1 Tax=Lewinella sp. JB7 TaxID=2962887 RepID=UPI0020CA1DB5|nr:choice-of-anchor B family protein [Lewinella sp. JB7]MCP9235353.1 choice-of-anchor B family protein [Lewinella sp. JB7]
MKPTFTLFLLLLGATPLLSQFNATLRSNLDYDTGVNDIWGYVAPDGTEYALVGLDRGVSVVSLADPDNPVEIGRTTGAFSPWRDVKTYGEYAYATSDRGQDGLTVIDLSNLPESISFANHTYTVPGFQRTLTQTHNIYIDTVTALAFTAGGQLDLNGGGILIFDLAANPAHPPLIALGPEVYTHDVYVRDGIMYASELYLGELAIYDISDLQNIRELGRTPTPFAFTHNAWPSDDSQTIFTTDEKENAVVASYDISDYGDIRLLGQYRPLSSLGTNTIPHNVHVIDDYLSVSYYTDGLRVVDATDPANLIEVANYDTWPGPDGGFNGNWGSYPFLPSGLTLLSDRSTGLYVVDVDYVRAARLGGTVTDRRTGNPINNATVHILADQLNASQSDATGNYKTGIATAGTYRLAVSAGGYLPDTVTVALTSGDQVTVNLTLNSIPTYSDVRLTVRDRRNGTPLADARAYLQEADTSFTAASNENGEVLLTQVENADYRIYVTAFGYLPRVMDNMASEDIDGSVVLLEPGYADGFVTDLGWTSTLSGDNEWRRIRPSEQATATPAVLPTTDAQGDPDDWAYLVALDAGTEATLRSPGIRLTEYTRGAALHYAYYLGGDGTGSGSTDNLVIRIQTRDGEVYRLAGHTSPTVGWLSDSLNLPAEILSADSVYLTVTATSGANGGLATLVAGFDNFLITQGALSTSTRRNMLPAYTVRAFPNPATEFFTLSLDDPNASAVLRVYNQVGQIVDQRTLRSGAPVFFGADLPTGIYFATVYAPGRLPAALKLVKN